MASTRRAVFVDRDGTLNVNVEYLSDPECYRLYPGVAEGLRLLRERGFLIVVVTNQSGVNRGLFDLGTLERIHQRMRSDLAREGARLDAVYFCPHRPDENCACRKPNTLLFERAVEELGLDPQGSFVIGDTKLDIEAGRRMGCRTALVPEPHNQERARQDMERGEVRPDYFGRDFLSAVRWILEQA